MLWREFGEMWAWPWYNNFTQQYCMNCVHVVAWIWRDVGVNISLSSSV